MDAIHRERITRLQEIMATRNVDALLVLTSEDYIYFTGDLRRQPRTIIPQEGDPILLVFASEVEEARESTGLQDIRPYRGLHEMMLAIMSYFKTVGEKPRVAISMEFGTPAFLLERFKMANPRVEVVDSKTLVSPLRQVKSAEEIELIRQASALADLGIETAKQAIRPGVTELDVATEVEYVLKKKGMDRLSFPMFVNSGRRSLWLHGMATRKVIEPGDLIVVDIGPVYQGYCADICRTFSVGEPSQKAAELYNLYYRMQTTALNEAQPGKPLHQIEEQIEKLLDEGGYRDYYLRGFIHGIGLGFEETPFPTIFPEDVLVPLEEGMTLAVGHAILSVPGIGGVRVEDTALVTASGAQLLTHAPREGIIVV